MTQKLEQEFKSLISLALAECDNAIKRGDLNSAELWKSEAFELISKLPENAIHMSIAQ